MRWLIALLSLIPICLSGAEAKWIHATSAHFDMYTDNSDGDAKAALVRLETSRAFFLNAIHAHDPGNQSVRIVAFKGDADYSKYKPADVRTAKAFGLAPATVVVQDLKPDTFDQLFREYAQLALDDSGPTLPYWFRAGLAAVYSTMKPGDKGIDLGALPRSDLRNGQAANVSLPLLFSVNRETFLASRENGAAAEFSSGTGNAALGARAVALDSLQGTLGQSQDFARSAWLLVHMLIFQQEYRPKFGEFLRTLAGGMETGTAFGKVYAAPLSKIQTDLVRYSEQTGLMIMTAPFKFEMPSPPVVKPATKEEQDKVFAELKR